MKINEIQDLIKFVAKSGVTEVEIEEKDFKIIIKAESKADKKDQQPIYIQAAAPQAMPQMQMAPAVAAAPQPAAPQAPAMPAASEDSKYITIKSPMIGTFYRASSPDKPAFVEVGNSIKKGDTVCVVEAMKLFNEIEAEIAGKIVKVLVDDATPVEYDQPLFLVDPA